MDVRAQPCVVTIDEIDGKGINYSIFVKLMNGSSTNYLNILEKTNLAEDMPKVSTAYQGKLAAFKTPDLAAKISTSKKRHLSSHAPLI